MVMAPIAKKKRQAAPLKAKSPPVTGTECLSRRRFLAASTAPMSIGETA